MSLHLDARQRAMLQEMGVTVWAPPPAAEPTAAPETAPAEATRAPVPPPPASRPAPARQAAAPTSAAPIPSPAAALLLHAPQALYPTADPARTPAGLGAGWLIVAESPSPTEPLAGDAGKLLDNMLRAMRLHQHPRVFLAALERMAGVPEGAPIATDLADAVARLRPAMVLVLGHVAARAALGRAEPLGRLRAEPHAVAGCPAVVTYDPAFLLRQQDSKAAAWADLCRALAVVRRAAAS